MKHYSTMTIQPGCLYWDISDNKPIGSTARRAPDKGLRVTDVSVITQWHGCDRTGYAPDGSKVAFHTEFTKELYHHVKAKNL